MTVQRLTRGALVGLLVFVALNAFAGGYYGLAGAGGVPREWLAGSPFESYLVPSLVLAIVVGGSSLLAVLALGVRHRWSRHLAALAGVVLVGWIAIQLAMIGFVSFLQPVMAIIGVGVIGLAYGTRGRGAS